MCQAMQEHPDTLKELQKINQIRDIFKSNGVFDRDSFFEFKTDME
jgi:hypothetical protein